MFLHLLMERNLTRPRFSGDYCFLFSVFFHVSDGGILILFFFSGS